jgi:hypothetical protein
MPIPQAQEKSANGKKAAVGRIGNQAVFSNGGQQHFEEVIFRWAMIHKSP